MASPRRAVLRWGRPCRSTRRHGWRSSSIDHAGLAEGAAIEMTLVLDAGTIRLTLIDPAPPFDPRLMLAPDALPPERGGGAGLAMLRAWAQVERYDRDGDRNILVLSLPG
jgi:serine/threonine-protein kinase RsbW